MKYASLDYIVKNVLVQMEESSLRRYQTLLQYAVRGARQLNLFGANQQAVKTKFLDMLPNKAVNLPVDFVKYLKIGMCVDGRIVTLGLDENLCIGEKFSECGDPLEVAVTNTTNADYSPFSFGYPFLGFYHNNQFVSGLFGLGGGFNSRGYYRINYETNQIQFASIVPDSQIILEYVSDGVNLDGTALVPMEAVEYLIAFVHWKTKEASPQATESEIARWERRTMIEFRNAKHFALSFTVSEYLDAYRSTINALPKR